MTTLDRLSQALPLAVLLLAGCSGGAGPEGGTATGGPAGATPTGAAGSGTPGTLPDLKGRKVVVATDATYPPMEWVEKGTERIVGFDPDLMGEIAKRIHIEPEFQNADFSTIFAALMNGQFDAVMSSATITPERESVVAFSRPYIAIGQVLVVRAGATRVTGVADLAGDVLVGVQTGTTGEQAAKTAAKVPDLRIKRYQTIDLAFADLANGSIDAVVADSPTVANYVNEERYRGRLAIVGEPFTMESYGIAVAKSSTALLAAIDLALAELEKDGTIARLKDRHGIR